MAELPTLFSRDPWNTDALDLFVSQCLTEGGVWGHPRTSDGISRIHRVLDRGPDALGVSAWIYQIEDQSLHSFWLEIRRIGSESFAWSLYFDVIARARRHEETALDNHDRPDEIEWRATLTGEAAIEGGVLMPTQVTSIDR